MGLVSSAPFDIRHERDIMTKHSRRRLSAPSGVLPIAIGVAGALTACAVFNLAAAQRAERVNPARGRILWVNGVRLHMLDTRGDGFPVVLLHGNGATSADMDASGLINRLGPTIGSSPSTGPDTATARDRAGLHGPRRRRQT
jgi:hypothetical protein